MRTHTQTLFWIWSTSRSLLPTFPQHTLSTLPPLAVFQIALGQEVKIAPRMLAFRDTHHGGAPQELCWVLILIWCTQKHDNVPSQHPWQWLSPLLLQSLTGNDLFRLKKKIFKNKRVGMFCHGYLLLLKPEIILYFYERVKIFCLQGKEETMDIITWWLTLRNTTQAPFYLSNKLIQ